MIKGRPMRFRFLEHVIGFSGIECQAACRKNPIPAVYLKSGLKGYREARTMPFERMLTIQVNPIISDKQALSQTTELTHFVSPFAKYCQLLRIRSEGGMMPKRGHDTVKG
jgi:hypothetical protein